MTRSNRFLNTTIHSSSSPASESPNETSEQSEFVLILAALLCALVCIIGLISVAYCTWIQRRMLAAEQIRRANQPSSNKGINKKVVESLPKYAYDSNKEESGGKLSSGDCVICLVEYEYGDEIRVLPECGHGFHVGCIDEWLECHSSCPSCRQLVVVTRCKRCGGVPAVGSEKVTLVVENEGIQQNGGSIEES